MEENKKIVPNKPAELNDNELDKVSGGSRYVYFDTDSSLKAGDPCSVCGTPLEQSGTSLRCPVCSQPATDQ